MFGLTVVTPPAKEPLDLGDVKRHLRYEPGYEDVLILSLITAARQYVETWTGKALITQTLRLTRDYFPGLREGYTFRLPKPPLATVTSVQYTDTAGATQTVDSATYVVDVTAEVGRIGLAWGEIWPTDAIEQIAAVKVNYTAGYGLTGASVPAPIKQAMLLLIGHWFVNREAVGSVGGPVEMAVSSLLGSQWSGSLAGTFG